MKHQVSPNKDLTFFVTAEDISRITEHAGNQSYLNFAVESDDKDKEGLKGACLGCSDSKMFDPYPSVNGFQVVPPSYGDEIFFVNIRLNVIKSLPYSAVYDRKTNATITIERAR
jgi:hypothetical protein